jgi:penicillin amidase
VAVALDLLLAWDGDMAAPLPQPLIFNAWLRRFIELALAAGGAPAGRWGNPPEFAERLMRDPALAARWCRGDCAALAGRALAEAVAALQAETGRDPGAWRWADVHQARFEHPLLRGLPLLGRLSRLQAATAGDGQTLNRGGLRGGEGLDGFRHVHGAGLRLVADLADTEATLAMIATGQSGNPLSRHWGDLLRPWRDGETLRLTREPAAVAGRVTLSP